MTGLVELISVDKRMLSVASSNQVFMWEAVA